MDEEPSVGDHLGPIDFVVVEFTAVTNLTAGLDRLLGLVDAGYIRVLDLEFVTNVGGALRKIAAQDVGADLIDFAGAASGLLDRDDLDTVAADLTPETSAVILIYEELSILQVLDAWERDGARLVSEGPVDVVDLEAALEEVR